MVHTKEGLLDLHKRAYQSYDAMLDHIAKLPADALNKEHEILGWKTLRDTLLHMANSEEFWMRWLASTAWSKWDLSEFDSVDKIRAVFHRVAEDTRRYLSGLTDAELNAPVLLERGEDKLTTTPAIALLHIVTHGFHHKGTVVAICRALGHPAPDTDLNVSP